VQDWWRQGVDGWCGSVVLWYPHRTTSSTSGHMGTLCHTCTGECDSFSLNTTHSPVHLCQLGLAVSPCPNCMSTSMRRHPAPCTRGPACSLTLSCSNRCKACLSTRLIAAFLRGAVMTLRAGRSGRGFRTKRRNECAGLAGEPA
jgi:hypothetical protein